MHLAQLNVGRLVAETDDPRVAEFMAALDRVNGLGKRMPGFVWMMEGSGEPGTGNTEAKIDGDPRYVSNLTVWESVESLEHFVWNTVHRQFYERRRGVVRGARRAALRDVVGAGGAPADASTRRWRGSTTCGRTATATMPSAGRGSRRRGSGGSGTAPAWRRSRRWNRTRPTTAAHEFAMGFWDFGCRSCLLALVVIPYWKLWQRTGHSGAWGLLMLVPLANLISLWVLAFKRWPALGEEDRRP